MSNSYRTQKESIIARRRISRDSDGAIKYPRVIEKKPAPGDIHALDKRLLERILPDLPIESVYGLRRIELRARKGAQIGKPFATYLQGERAVILYSLPLAWSVPHLEGGFQETVGSGAVFTKTNTGWLVQWKDESHMAFWFFNAVFTHELGHHFDWQYRNKNGLVEGHRHSELIADVRGAKFREAFFKLRRSRRTQSVSERGDR